MNCSVSMTERLDSPPPPPPRRLQCWRSPGSDSGCWCPWCWWCTSRWSRWSRWSRVRTCGCHCLSLCWVMIGVGPTTVKYTLVQSHGEHCHRTPPATPGFLQLPPPHTNISDQCATVGHNHTNPGWGGSRFYILYFNLYYCSPLSSVLTTGVPPLQTVCSHVLRCSKNI